MGLRVWNRCVWRFWCWAYPRGVWMVPRSVVRRVALDRLYGWLYWRGLA
jgi:hypothetical protein